MSSQHPFCKDTYGQWEYHNQNNLSNALKMKPQNDTQMIKFLLFLFLSQSERKWVLYDIYSIYSNLFFKSKLFLENFTYY